MIPTIIFSTSHYFQTKIISAPYDWSRLNSFKIEMDSFFKENSNEILNNISRTSGITWTQTNIPVCIFHGWQPSISMPLLLNSDNESLDFSFFLLIHELIHNNISELEIKKENGEWDYIELEATVNIITINILKDIYPEEKIIHLSKRAEAGGSYKYVWKRVNEISDEIKEKEISIKQWIKLNPKIKKLGSKDKILETHKGTKEGMININFKISYPLTEGILRHKYDHEDLMIELSKVEKIFLNKKVAIFKSFSKVTHMDFKIKELDVWLTKGVYPSISNPPLLNISKKENTILFDLIYILTHKLFFDNAFYDFIENPKGINESREEGLVYLISKKVIENILSKEEFAKIIGELRSDMFNLYIWDECDDFEKRIDFNIPLLKHSRDTFY